MEIVKKGWGYERILVNRDFCGKILHFDKGKRCSWHKHLKDEFFLLQSGQLLLKWGHTDNLDEAHNVMLHPGDTFDIPPWLRHQMIAMEDSDLIEFSTHHEDSDIIRIIRGD